jgi:hypothetical protein
MVKDPETEQVLAVRNVVRRILYGCVFYYASMKLAPKLVRAVASYWDVEIQADFK